MELYLRRPDRYDRQEGELPPIGLFLYSEGNTDTSMNYLPRSAEILSEVGESAILYPAMNPLAFQLCRSR